MTPESFKLTNKLINVDKDEYKNKDNKDLKWNNYVEPSKSDLDKYYLSFEEAMLIDFEKAIKKDLKLQLKNNRL